MSERAEGNVVQEAPLEKHDYTDSTTSRDMLNDRGRISGILRAEQS